MPQFILCDCCGKSVEDFESRLEYFKHLQIAEKCKSLRNICFNEERRFLHYDLGWNYRFTNWVNLVYAELPIGSIS